MNRPWLQFHTRDWLDNKELRRCSPTARSVLADLMCLAHEGEPYGYLADKIGPLSDEYMASRCVLTVAVFRRSLFELQRAARIETEGPRLLIRRMVDDEALRIKRAEGGKLGGNPNIERKVNLQGNLPANHQGYPLPRVRTDTRSDSGISSDFDLDFFESIWKNWKRQRRDQPMQIVVQLVIGRDGFDWPTFRANAPPYIAWCEAMKPEPWKYASLTLWEWIEGGMILPPEAKPKGLYEELYGD